MQTQELPITLSPRFYAETMAGEAYTAGASLFELNKNGIGATGRSQQPKAPVRNTLISNHPLGSGKKKTLVVMDQGTGFTEKDILRFCRIGRDEEDERNDDPFSQKRTGSKSALRLNDDVFEQEKFDRGIYILTRTTVSGPVRKITMTPELLSKGSLPSEMIDPGSPEMRPFGNIVGSFSIILIPASVFQTEEEIRNALRPYLPCHPNMLLNIMVGGIPLLPPPLPSTSFALGKIVAHITLTTDPRYSGIQLADAKNGTVCAYAPNLREKIPHPFGDTGFTGVAFIPNISRHQNANRDCLNSKYLMSKTWAEHCETLRHMARDVAKLRGDESATENANDQAARLTRELAATLRETFGIPQGTPPHPPNGTGRKSEGGNTPDKPKSGEDTRPSGKPETSPRRRPQHKHHDPLLSFKVEGKTFHLTTYDMANPGVFCTPGSAAAADGTLLVNPGYEGFKGLAKGAIRTVALQLILNAATSVLYATNAEKAMHTAQELSYELRTRS